LFTNFLLLISFLEEDYTTNMKYFTTLLTIASLATSVLSAVIVPLNAAHTPNVEIEVPELQQAEPIGSLALTERGIPTGCLANVFTLFSINRSGRFDLQAYLDARNTVRWDINRNINVNLDFTQVRTGYRYINFSITNRSQFVSNALILSNYRDTRDTTVARETVRISIPRAQGVSLGTIAPTTYAGCVELPRLDGTWYAQLER
jgi:hypothetical protein